jgi:hypothetical protein
MSNNIKSSAVSALEGNKSPRTYVELHQISEAKMKAGKKPLAEEDQGPKIEPLFLSHGEVKEKKPKHDFKQSPKELLA